MSHWLLKAPFPHISSGKGSSQIGNGLRVKLGHQHVEHCPQICAVPTVTQAIAVSSGHIPGFLF